MKGTMILTMGLAAVVTLVGCGANNPAGPGALNNLDRFSKPQDARLVGVWSMQTDNALAPVIAFKIGDRVDVTEDDFPKGPLTLSGTYQVDGNQIALKASAVEGQQGEAAARILARFTTYTYAINDDGNELTLKANGETIRWKKM
jgi:hypothetical protein